MNTFYIDFACFLSGCVVTVAVVRYGLGWVTAAEAFAKAELAKAEAMLLTKAKAGVADAGSAISAGASTIASDIAKKV